MGFSREGVLVGYIDVNAITDLVEIELNIIIGVILNSMWSYKTDYVINCIEYVEYNGKPVVGIIALTIDVILTLLKVFVFRE